MTIISISGVDGSGKSTQVNFLKKDLKSRGHRVMYFHAVDFSIGNILFQKKGHSKSGASKDFGDSITKASWSAIQLRKIALLIDLLRFEIAQKKWQKDDYTHIISDRYFYDNVINILYLSQGSKVKSFGAELLTKLIPTPTHAFFLSVSPEIIMGRTRAPEQGLEYLTQKHSLFTQRTETLHLITIDGSLPQREVFTQLSSKI